MDIHPSIESKQIVLHTTRLLTERPNTTMKNTRHADTTGHDSSSSPPRGTPAPSTTPPRPAHFDASRRHERDLSHDGFSRARARDDVFAEVQARRSVRVNIFDRTRDVGTETRVRNECTWPVRERMRDRCARPMRARRSVGWTRARDGGVREDRGRARAYFCLSFPSIARVVEAGDARGRGRGRRDRARGSGRGGKALSIHPRRRAAVFVGVRSVRGG